MLGIDHTPARERSGLTTAGAIRHRQRVSTPLSSGRGGMGVVYKAEDTRLRRSVALKFVSDELSRDPEALSRFAREAQTASALNHPNICTIHDIGQQDERSFIVMEYLEGTTLKDRLAAGALSVNAALDVGAQVAAALDAAHTAGIIHRDIKPENIFIGPRDHVKVLDFGLAKSGPATPQVDVTPIAGTRQGVVMGTAAYMAPEQARGESGSPCRHLELRCRLMKWSRGRGPLRPSNCASRARRSWKRIAKCLETDANFVSTVLRAAYRSRDLRSGARAWRATTLRRAAHCAPIGAGAVVWPPSARVDLCRRPRR